MAGGIRNTLNYMSEKSQPTTQVRFDSKNYHPSSTHCRMHSPPMCHRVAPDVHSFNMWDADEFFLFFAERKLF